MTDQSAQLSHTLKISPKFAEAVGYFMVAFSRCEESVNHTICALLGVQGHSGALEVTAAVRDLGQRIILLNRLGKRLLGTEIEIKQLGRVISAMSFLNEHRVNLVHGEFATLLGDVNEPHVMRTTVQQSSVERRVHQFSSDFLLDLAAYALEVDKALSTFRVNLLHGLDGEVPSLDKRPAMHPPFFPPARN